MESCVVCGDPVSQHQCVTCDGVVHAPAYVSTTGERYCITKKNISSSEYTKVVLSAASRPQMTSKCQKQHEATRTRYPPLTHSTTFTSTIPQLITCSGFIQTEDDQTSTLTLLGLRCRVSGTQQTHQGVPVKRFSCLQRKKKPLGPFCFP